MMTLKVQLRALPQASLAVQITELVPFANVDPLGGTQVMLTSEQLSLAVAS
jgi:hypothetical protein